MSRLPLMLVLACSVLSAPSHAAMPQLDSLQALQGLENGMWHWRVTSTPSQPILPDRDARQCVNIAQHMTQFIRTVQQQAPQCDIRITRDDATQAALTSQCPAMQVMPGVSLPAMQIDYLVTREADQQVRVDAQLPNLFGLGRIQVLGQANRLGACPAR